MTLDQIVIAIAGCLSSWMIHSADRKVRLMACWIGLFAQPFWFYAAYEANQWGILLMDVVYTAGFIRGAHRNWRLR